MWQAWFHIHRRGVRAAFGRTVPGSNSVGKALQSELALCSTGNGDEFDSRSKFDNAGTWSLIESPLGLSSNCVTLTNWRYGQRFSVYRNGPRSLQLGSRFLAKWFRAPPTTFSEKGKAIKQQDSGPRSLRICEVSKSDAKWKLRLGASYWKESCEYCWNWKYRVLSVSANPNKRARSKTSACQSKKNMCNHSVSHTSRTFDHPFISSLPEYPKMLFRQRQKGFF